MTTLHGEGMVIRARLLAVEKALIEAGKRNVTIPAAGGVFTWVERGAGQEPVENLGFIDEVQELEDMLIRTATAHLVQATHCGTFTWGLRN